MLSRQIASKLRGYETPFYLYDMALLRQTLESVVYESKKYGYKVHYAIKANYDDHLLAIIREYGLGIDCASGNELRKAVEAGFDPKGIVYAGVGKRDKELRYAIEQDILAINCESIEELELVDALADWRLALERELVGLETFLAQSELLSPSAASASSTRRRGGVIRPPSIPVARQPSRAGGGSSGRDGPRTAPSR